MGQVFGKSEHIDFNSEGKFNIIKKKLIKYIIKKYIYINNNSK